MVKSARYLNVSDTAAKLGLTAKALRLYERQGLVIPPRNKSGWRIYGREEIERLHAVISLKSFGLTLSKIHHVLLGGVDLDDVLKIQEEALTVSSREMGNALSLIRAARTRLKMNGKLTTEELIELTRETMMSDKKPNAVMEELIDRHFSTAQQEKLHARTWTEEDQAKASKKWGELITEATRLAQTGDASSPEALDLAVKWKTEAEKFTNGDPSMTASVGALYAEGFSSEGSAASMPMSKEVWNFMREAQAILSTLDNSDDGIV